MKDLVGRTLGQQYDTFLGQVFFGSTFTRPTIRIASGRKFSRIKSTSIHSLFRKSTNVGYRQVKKGPRRGLCYLVVVR